MLASEKNLLLAVRNRLRTVAQYANAICDIEFDEMAPAIIGDTYVIVMPGGWNAGPRHNTCGGVDDLVYSIRIAVVKRVTAVPRDRMRGIFYALSSSINAEFDKIHPVVDFNYTTMNAANTLITAETASVEGFIIPLRFSSMGPLRLVSGEMFAGTTEDRAGLMRTAVYGGARRITHK